MIVVVPDRCGPFIATAIRALDRQMQEAGKAAPPEALELAEALWPRNAEPANPVLLDSAQAARALHVSSRTLRRRVADGTVPARRVGRRVLFDASDLRRLGRGA